MNKTINPGIKALMPFHLAQSMRFVKVQYGGGITGMSGSIAGNTHSRNRGGNYIRARTKPTNPNTAEQIACRSALAFLMEYWRDTLTAVQRAAWEVYASQVSMKDRLGNSIYHTGQNHFIRSNTIYKAHAIGSVDAGPVVFSLPAMDPNFAVTANAGTQLFHIAFDNTLPWAAEPTGRMHFWQGFPQNPTVNYFKGPWMYCASKAGCADPLPTSPLDEAARIPISEGQRLWIYCRFQRADGRITSKNYADCLVEA